MSRIFWVAMLGAMVACGSPPGAEHPRGVKGAIVGGEKTTGWPAVGALVADVPGWGYIGPFCTGTLIAPRWVLTAAHCISSYRGMPILPFFVKFYVGTNANPSGGGPPQAGALYQAEEFFPHPEYDSTLMTVGHDIGLVRLKTDVAGVEPVPINRRPLRGKHLGSRVLFVGFGVSDGIKQSGSGVKRETTMPMTWFDTFAFYAEPDGSGTCSGDSGGPGLLQMDRGETWYQIGVISAGTESPGTAGDPCLTGMGIYTRVDAHASWIAEVTGQKFPPCAQDFCLCNEACQPDGGCNDSVCRTRTCLLSLACLSSCVLGDVACAVDCRILTRPEDEVAFDKIQYCIYNKCKKTTDILGCAQSQCADRLNECISRSGTDGTCATYAACREGCAGDNALCVFACDAGAPEGARTAWVAADECLRQADCPVVVSPLAIQDPCAREHCLNEVYACYPPPSCNPLGGTCPEGTACREQPAGGSWCVASEGRQEGESCDEAALAPCADGLRCTVEVTGAVCRRACLEDQDCSATERCDRLDGAHTAFGVCRPTEGSDGHQDTWPSNGVGVADALETTEDAFLSSDSSSEGGHAGASGSGCATRSNCAHPWPLILLLGGFAVLAAFRKISTNQRS